MPNNPERFEPETFEGPKEAGPQVPAVTSNKPSNTLADVKAFEHQLAGVDRSKQAGFLESFYIDVKNTTRDPSVLLAAAELLLRFGKEARLGKSSKDHLGAKLSSLATDIDVAMARNAVEAVRTSTRERSMSVLDVVMARTDIEATRTSTREQALEV